MGGGVGDFAQYVDAVKARWWLVALIVIVAVSAAYLHQGRSPVRHTASATLLVTATPAFLSPPAVSAGGQPAGPVSGMVTGDIVQLISSRAMADRVAKRLELGSPAQVQSAVSANPVRGTSFIQISASAQDPEQAARLANTTAGELVTYFQEMNRASVSEARRFVEEQLAFARAKLDASERAIQTFKESRQMPSVATAATQIAGEVAGAQLAIDAATISLSETEARLGAARSRLTREAPVIMASQSTADNPVWRQIQGRLIDLEIQRATLAQVYTPQHPRMERITREISELQSRLTKETRMAIAEQITTNNPLHARLVSDMVTLETERAAVTARVEALQVIQRRRQAAVMSIASAETEFARLTREQRILETNYTSLSARHQEMVIRENQAGFFPAGLHVLEAAVPLPSRPASIPVTTAAVAIIGLVVGIFAALVLGTLDDSIRGSQDAERVLGVPVLAHVPAQGGTSPAPAMYVLLMALILAVAFAVAAASRGGISSRAAIDHVRGGLASAPWWTARVAQDARR